MIVLVVASSRLRGIGKNSYLDLMHAKLAINTGGAHCTGGSRVGTHCTAICEEAGSQLVWNR